LFSVLHPAAMLVLRGEAFGKRILRGEEISSLKTQMTDERQNAQDMGKKGYVIDILASKRKKIV